MSEKAKMIAGKPYRPADAVLTADRATARQLCREYNSFPETDAGNRDVLLQKLLGTKPDKITVEPNFRCDYGYNIHLGDNFYANFDLIILDVCEVRIGKNCMIGPRVCICAATHPTDPIERNSGQEYGAPITIGDNVWIGAHAVINPGVELGDNVVVASGAVVTKSYGNNAVLAGVPAKIMKGI